MPAPFVRNSLKQAEYLRPFDADMTAYKSSLAAFDNKMI
jgi:hypothetical protein